MTQLELVEHKRIISEQGHHIRRTTVAVSSSHSALVDHCKDTFGEKVGEVGYGAKQTYYTIQTSPIVIVPSKF